MDSQEYEARLNGDRAALKIIDSQRDRIRYLEAQVAGLREALTKLSNEVLGSMALFEPIARQQIGNTNYAILMQRAEEACAVLKAKP